MSDRYDGLLIAMDYIYYMVEAHFGRGYIDCNRYSSAIIPGNGLKLMRIEM